MTRPARAAQWAAALLLAGTAAQLAGCAQPQPLAPLAPAAVPVQAQALGLAAAPTPADDVPAPDWWRRLGDTRLDALVEQALAGQPRLALIAARLEQARVASALAGSAGQMQAGLSAEATLQRYSAKGLVPPPIAGTVRSSGDVMLGASWELDFWGRHGAALDQALGQERAARADLAAARSLLATEITRSWVALAQAGSLAEVAEQTIAQREHILRLSSERQRAGLGSAADVALAQARLADARGSRLAVAERQVLLRHQLAALAAKPLNSLDSLDRQAPTLADLRVPAVGLGTAAADELPRADLLGRRADIAAARARVDAAGLGVKVARLGFYPDLSLNVFAGLSALGLDRLVDVGSRTYGAGPALRLPLFDQPGLNAQLGLREAEAGAAVASYNATVIEAARGAADALALRSAVARQQAQQAEAQAQAEEAWRLARARYDGGLSNLLEVLAADDLRLAQARAAAELRGRAVDAHVQLMHALGGGWSAGELDTPPGGQAATASTPSTATPAPTASTGRPARTSTP
ncbi:MAG: hypothetical protein RL722_2604 [Pseudomonadota bacterium]|jgi:NodT family efflux transporter outer membrane factor (OMF) lipoprotein